MSDFSDLLLSLTPSLYWKLDSVALATDQSGNGRNGTAGGGVSIGAFGDGPPILGENDTSTDFDGTDDRVESSYNPFINGTTRTFTGWAWRDASASIDAFLGGNVASVTPVFNLASGNNSVQFQAQANALTATWTAAWPGNAQWAFFALIFREASDTADLYINGVFISTQAMTNAYNAAPGNYKIGARSGTATDPFDGKLAHFAVFESGLTAQNIADLYEYAISGIPPPATFPLRVREKPPLRLTVNAEGVGGHSYRWGLDEPSAENVFSGLRCSDTMPGGDESLDVTLPRKAGVDYSDLERLSTLTVRGAGGGEVVNTYRLETAPRVSGNEMSVSPGAVGWQAHLDDDKSAKEVYVDRSLENWKGMSNARKIANLGAGVEFVFDPTVEPDATTGEPALVLSFDGTGAASIDWWGEAYYDCTAGLTVSTIYYDYTSTGTLTAYEAYIGSATADTGGSYSISADLITGTDTAGSGTADPTDARFGFIQFKGPAGGTPTERTHMLSMRRLAVFGSHGITKRGTAPDETLFASDVVANALSRWAPALDYTTGANGTIAPTSFGIPQLVFLEPTSAAEIIRAALVYEQMDWAVWGKTFYLHERGARGKRWQARIAPSQLQETGPQVDRVWNGILVRYNDVDGSTLTVGPVGSGADTQTSTLQDADPLNPANIAGIRRWDVLDMGIVSTATAATEVGRRFLEQANLLDSSGQATLTGHVTDDHGVIFPAHAVHAGDYISFTDSSDTSYRRIVRRDYQDRTATVDLDAPPEGLEHLLAQLGVVLTPLGL